MERDLELVRNILVYCHDDVIYPECRVQEDELLDALGLTSRDADTLRYHMWMLKSFCDNDYHPAISGYLVRGLTWAGHELLCKLDSVSGTNSQ